ncbi:hypothetical protein BU26DRAFT_149714 [Trematosphaeria pertusa]|uniref:Uncharacterized protein n=1 Tax=Trematosphaeria pertusa TaxID=390896 RepID=A0A6A6IXA7_9PLEO|nr:uncharacterized protein BU26DRAFT_149714 [Trematosphaeria pertusa]KAF2255024.1 hypothetical protein BU26DRAFT_149714 [Trematosphaeria pertusa]
MPRRPFLRPCLLQFTTRIPDFADLGPPYRHTSRTGRCYTRSTLNFYDRLHAETERRIVCRPQRGVAAGPDSIFLDRISCIALAERSPHAFQNFATNERRKASSYHFLTGQLYRCSSIHLPHRMSVAHCLTPSDTISLNSDRHPDAGGRSLHRAQGENTFRRKT